MTVKSHLSPKKGLCVSDHPVLNEVDVGKDDVVSVIRINGLSAPGPRSSYTVHFGYSGHLGPHLSGHYIQLATISDLNIIE